VPNAIQHAPQGRRSGAVGLFAAAALLLLLAWPRGGWFSDLAMVGTVVLVLLGTRSWQANRTDPRRALAEIDRERQERFRQGKGG